MVGKSLLLLSMPPTVSGTETRILHSAPHTLPLVQGRATPLETLHFIKNQVGPMCGGGGITLELLSSSVVFKLSDLQQVL